MKTIGLFSILFFSSTAFADQYIEAVNAVAQSTYKISGIEKEVNEIGDIELKKVPKTYQTVGGNIFLIAKIISDRKIEIKWNF